MAAGLFLVLLSVGNCPHYLILQAIHIMSTYQLVWKRKTRSYIYAH